MKGKHQTKKTKKTPKTKKNKVCARMKDEHWSYSSSSFVFFVFLFFLFFLFFLVFWFCGSLLFHSFLMLRFILKLEFSLDQGWVSTSLNDPSPINARNGSAPLWTILPLLMRGMDQHLSERSSPIAICTSTPSTQTLERTCTPSWMRWLGLTGAAVPTFAFDVALCEALCSQGVPKTSCALIGR